MMQAMPHQPTQALILHTRGANLYRQPEIMGSDVYRLAINIGDVKNAARV